jgi:hypothetical protein
LAVNQPMPPVVIENPILNSPFEEPRRHFRFSDEGITNEIIDGRRVLLGHTSILMTMRYVHPAAEQKRIAIDKLEVLRAQGVLAAAALVEQSQKVPTKVTTVCLVN